ncbi:MAG: NUDIX hydrolase [Candidatus Dormibacteria bacterium]
MPAPRRRPSEVSAGGVVVRRSGTGWDVCLIRVGRSWSLPKGGIEAGESPAQAALREVAEETGLPPACLQLRGPLPAAEYAYRRDARLVFKRVHHFLVEAAGSEPLRHQASEVDEAAWFPLQEATSRVAYRDVRSALVEAGRLLDAPPA